MKSLLPVLLPLLPGKELCFLISVFLGFLCYREIFVIGITLLPCCHISKRTTKISCKLFSELFCSSGITMIVLPAPSLIYLVYSSCGTMSDNLAILPRTHTFFIKRNHCTVCTLVISSCLCNAIRLCKSISICYNSLQRFHSFFHNASALCKHFF